MIGSIFPACQCFEAVPGVATQAEECDHRHTWKWFVGCALGVAGLLWFVHAQLASRGFDWQLAGRRFPDLRWSWLVLRYHSDLRDLLWSGRCAGRFS